MTPSSNALCSRLNCGAPQLAVGVGAEDLGETTYDELDRRMAKWKLNYPEAPIHPVATKGGIGHFLATHADETVQLTVIGDRDVDQIAYLVWPDCHPEAQHGERSVMFTERGSGAAGVLYRGGPTGYRLALVAPGLAEELSPFEGPVTISPHPPPCLREQDAIERMNLLGVPFLFFIDAAFGRISVLYRR